MNEGADTRTALISFGVVLCSREVELKQFIFTDDVELLVLAKVYFQVVIFYYIKAFWKACLDSSIDFHRLLIKYVVHSRGVLITD